ncbi:hypothetical protein E1B28_001477 [Marasmius oreades]|uniref:Uncharacterized protein n=1 Tax=Marasmius oreades TaxID=181124 RepID=A0A9P7V3H0_9AGAR|nr:uncharacterized protein E1B28_001477 [Marasmius oreades]KAG7099651.1 hypothetical protein E1B28_001477 [Marasmius oreades]
MQVAYRSSVVRRLGPSSHTFRSNSTSVPRKGLYKATSWGDISLPGRGESASKEVDKEGPDSATRSTPRTASSSLLSHRLKQWARPLKEALPTTDTKTESSSVSTPKADVPEFEDLPSTPPTLEIPEDAQNLDMGAWNRAVRKLPRKNANLPVMNLDTFSGDSWTPGQPVPRRNQNTKTQRTPNSGQRREPRQPQQHLQGQPSGRRPQRENNPVSGNNRSRRGTGNVPSKFRSSTSLIRKVEEVAEEPEDEAKIFAGEEGLFSPKPGQSQEEWLTEFLVTDPDPEAPGRVDPDIHVASNVDSMFTTGTPLLTGVTPMHLVNISTATPTRILRRHGGDYSHFLPPKIQSTATKDLSVMVHAHLTMAKRRDTELTKKAKASFIIKNTTQPRRSARV